MSTDFCVEAILQKSGSSSSLSSSSESSKLDTPVQKLGQKRQREEEGESEQPVKRGRMEEEESEQPVKRGRMEEEESEQPVKRGRMEEEESEQPAKRGRTCYSKKQLSLLESHYSQNAYPDKLQKEDIAAQLGVTQRQVHVSVYSIRLGAVSVLGDWK